MVTFAVPVKENGELKAVVAGDVAMDAVVANVHGIRPTPASSGMLLDQNGTLIAANDPALTMKPFAQVVSGVDFNQVKSGHPVQALIGESSKTLLATPVQGTHWWLVVALDEKRRPPACWRC